MEPIAVTSFFCLEEFVFPTASQRLLGLEMQVC
jgi:hypothetical protein